MASALTTSALVTTYLGTTDYTAAQITAAVNATNDAVERYCGRVFAATTHYDWVRVANTGQIILDHSPILQLQRLAVGTRQVMRIDYSTPTDSFAMAQVGSGKLGLSGLSAGYSELTLSTYTTLALLKAAIDAIAGGYFTATVESEDSPLALKPMTADMLLSPCYLEGPDDTISAASIDEDAAIIDLGCRHSGWVYVQYKAGYAAIPEELAQVATEMASDILDSSKLNSNLQSERIGDWQYTVSTSTDQAVLSRYADRLSPYRRFRL